MHRSQRLRKDQADIIAPGPDVYDPSTGESTPGPDVTLWSGRVSVQPYVRMSSSSVEAPVGGIAIAIDAFTVLVPFDAPIDGRTDFRIAVGTANYLPQHEPLDPGGQHNEWAVICTKAR